MNEFNDKIKILQNSYTAGNYAKVIDGCHRLNKKYPNNPFLFNLNGLALQALSNHKSAIKFFKAALDIDNSNISAKNNLANSLKSIGELELSNKIYQEIIKKDPNYIFAYNNYANLKMSLNHYEEAINLLNTAINIAKKKNINPINFMLTLANAHQSINNKKEVSVLINKILEMEPSNIHAHKILSSLTKYTKENTKSLEHVLKMENLIKENLNDFQKLTIFFSLGKAYDELKDIDKAFNYLSKANQIHYKLKKTNIASTNKIIKNLIKTFKDIDFKKINERGSDKKVIFICGMPRSGTTLVEQIIAAHNKVYGAGEKPYLYNIIYDEFIFENSLNKQKIIENQSSSLNLINNKYFNFFNLFNIKENIITDKTPQNFMWIGFIKIFFPNSKIINCQRLAPDVCLSIFKNYFSSSIMNWAYDQKDIANYYNSYDELIKFWKSKLSKDIYTIEYEQLVKNKEEEIRKIIKFCDLEWDENCLNFYKKNKTPIQTASISQAREEIYTSSLNSSLEYGSYLNDMFNSLN